MLIKRSLLVWRDGSPGLLVPYFFLPDISLARAEDFPPVSLLLQGEEKIVQISAFIAGVEEEP